MANSNPELDTIAAFSLSAGTLTTLPNSPSQLTSIPSALAINPAGTLLWVGSQLGEVYVYVINADGSLTLGASGNPVAAVAGSAMTVDPTGQWLLVESNTGTAAPVVVNVYQINSTNGTLTAASTPQVTLDSGSAFQLTFAPNGTQLFAALGTGGVDVLTFSPSSGLLTKLNILLQPLGSSYADQGLAVDPTGAYLFVAETGTNGVRVLAISANGSLNQVGSPYPTGMGARSVLVDSTGQFVYVSNAATNTISGFSLSSAGALTALAGSPYTTGSAPYSLSEDNTHSYLVAACLGGSPDLQVFAITPATGTSPGALTAASTASTGTAGTVSGAISVVATP